MVGYGTQRVKDLTGAASNVKMDEIPDSPGSSLIDALAGQIVGLDVNQGDGRTGSTFFFFFCLFLFFYRYKNYTSADEI